MEEKLKKRLELINEAMEKIKQLNSSCAFTTDFSSVEIIQRLVIEVKLLSFENKNYKKSLRYNRAYINKKENQLEFLKLENKELLDRLIKFEKDD